MKKIIKNKAFLGITVGLWVVILFAYNNCAGQKFSFSSSGLVDDQGQDDIEPFNPAEVEDFKCQEYRDAGELLGADGKYHIPARTSDGICYTLKLVSKADYPRSSVNPLRYDRVWSADHDASSYAYVSNPYDLGGKVVDLFIEGKRSIKLAGSKDGLSTIDVDNYILVGVGPTNEIQSQNPAYYMAYGTHDARILNDPKNDFFGVAPYNDPNGSYISFNDEPVRLEYEFGGGIFEGGTAHVDSFYIDGDMKTNSDYSIDLRALDCGSAAHITDIYLSFE